MEQVCVYDPKRDIMPVDQFGFVDIVKANAESAIDDPLQIIESRFNGMEDPNEIGVRPNDVFEEMQANKVISEYRPPKKSAELSGADA